MDQYLPIFYVTALVTILDNNIKSLVFFSGGLENTPAAEVLAETVWVLSVCGTCKL